MAALGHVDSVVFTGGIGENNAAIRSASLQGLESLGIVIDQQRNLKANRDNESEITGDGSPIKVFVIPTNEELQIARDTFEIARK
jgi:acetate kinase